MQDTMDWAKKYYSGQALESLANRQVSADVIEQAQKDWAVLIKDVEAALGEDPAGPKAQVLSARWRKLIEGFTGGNRESARRAEQAIRRSGQLAVHFQETL